MKLQRRKPYLVGAKYEQAQANVSNWLNARQSRTVRLMPEARSGEERRKPGSVEETTAECLRTIINSFEDEVVIIGSDYHVKQANNVVLSRLGADAEVAGKPCHQVIHGLEEPCRLPWCECPLGQVLETGKTIHVYHTRGSSGKTAEQEKWVEVVVSPLWDVDGNVTEAIELVRDFSENKRLQEEVLKANRELLALNSIALALSQSLDLKASLQTVAGIMLDALEARLSWVYLLEDDNMVPAAHASRGISSQVSDKLIEAIPSMVPGKQAAPASYSLTLDHSANTGVPSLWRCAITPLKCKGTVLGLAGVATANLPLDEHHTQLLHAIGNQIAVAVDRYRLYQEIQLARDARGKLLHQVISTQEEERRRIARELHDETGQTLTALRLCLERLSLELPRGKEEINTRLAQPLNLCQQVEDEIDKLIYNLRPALLDDLGVVKAIESYAQSRSKPAGINIRLKVAGEEQRLPDDKEVTLFRIVQESITNTIKHAQARNMIIHLQFKKDQVVARIEDDGCGFDVRKVASLKEPRRGLGLLGMRERMDLVGGTFDISSRPGAGTRIKVVVPLAEEGT